MTEGRTRKTPMTYKNPMKTAGLAIVLLLACSSERKLSDVPTAAELPDLVTKYEAFITKVAEVTKTGDCAAKGSALAPLFVMHKETDARMIAAMSDPALRDELQRLIDARGAAISTPEIAFIEVKQACSGKPGFPTYSP
jgi:hypothetical protein